MKHTMLQHLLFCLNEECLEVAKEVDKSLRFGIDDTNFLIPDGPTNRQRIVDELNDLMGVVKMMIVHGVIPADWLNAAKMNAKVEKVLDCMGYAQEVGTMEDNINDRIKVLQNRPTAATQDFIRLIREKYSI